MIHSAVALADQLKKCGGLKLREEDMRKWERELRVLNVTRASLTTQLVAARKQVTIDILTFMLLVYLLIHPLKLFNMPTNIFFNTLKHILFTPSNTF